MPLLRVAIVDDHRMFTEALAGVLAEQPDLRLVAAFASAEPDLPVRVLGARPDVVVVDVEPFEPFLAGALIERLTTGRSGLGVLVLTAADEAGRVLEAARGGALGWLSKQAPTAELVAALRAVGAGYAHYPAERLGPVLRSLVGELRRPGEPAGPLAVLSNQERRVLDGMVAGERGPEIAARLHLSAGTVRTHTQNIFAKLGVHSRLEAVTVARRAGLRPEAAIRDQRS